MKNRLGRAIVALIFLFFFGIYFYKQLGIRTFSGELASWGEATGLHPEDFEATADFTQTSEDDAAPEAETPADVPAATPEPTPAPLSFDLTSWEYMLVSAKHPIDQYVPENLAYLNQTADDMEIRTDYDEHRCPVDARIAQPLLDMAKACKDAGLPIYLSSGYRSYNEQSQLFRNKVNQGYTEDVAATIVARPGTSEHQTGLACDITDKYYQLKDSTLEQTPTYQWLKEHCADYGFVVRYPADKSGSADSVTGIIYEPWHFRYVGVEAAKYMTENNLTLEEFWERFGSAETAAETV